jgi:DNA-binding NarL/FixJ family response regulator
MLAMAGAGGERRANIVVVDDDVVDREVLRAEIAGRYRGAYGVVVGSSASETLMTLGAMQRNGQRVAVVLARQWMAEMTGADLLASIRSLHPRAKRVLLISPGDWGHERTADAIRGAISSGCAGPLPLQSAEGGRRILPSGDDRLSLRLDILRGGFGIRVDSP